MNAPEVLEITKDAVFVLIKVSAPVLVIALLVGLTISLFQALTQIQEMTLTFVPKMLAMYLSLILLMPFMAATLGDFAERISQKIIGAP